MKVETQKEEGRLLQAKRVIGTSACLLKLCGSVGYTNRSAAGRWYRGQGSVSRRGSGGRGLARCYCQTQHATCGSQACFIQSFCVNMMLLHACYLQSNKDNKVKKMDIYKVFIFSCMKWCYQISVHRVFQYLLYGHIHPAKGLYAHIFVASVLILTLSFHTLVFNIF
jgi:hypothetical protein